MTRTGLRPTLVLGAKSRKLAEHAFQLAEKPLPSALGTLIELRLILPEARLLHAQVGPRACRGENPSYDTFETVVRVKSRERHRHRPSRGDMQAASTPPQLGLPFVKKRAG